MPYKPSGKDPIENSERKSINISSASSSQGETKYFNTFLSTLPAMAYSINREGVIQHVSDVWLTTMGYQREEVIGRKSTDFLTKESAEYAKKSVLPEYFATESVENIPYQLLKKDGTIIDVLLSANSWKDQNGSFRGSLATMCDITKQKQVEGALKSSQELYESAQRMGHIGHWTFDLKSGKFWGSDEARRIYGFDLQRENFTTDEVENCIPDRQRVHQALVDLIEDGLPYDLEFKIQPFNGSQKKYIKSMAEVIVNKSGTPEKVDGAILDITDLKLVDEKLKKSEEKYRQLFDCIKDSILVADIERNIIDCNQNFLEWFGYTKEEIFGNKTLCLYESEEEFLKMGNKLKNRLDLGKKHLTYFINYKRKSGEIFPGETNAFILENDKGDAVGFIGIIRDITHQKTIERSLHKANDELTQKTVALKDINTALKVLLAKRDRDNRELEENIHSNCEIMVTPFLNKLKMCLVGRNARNLLDIVETNLEEIIAPFVKKLSNPIMRLTPSEIQISAMIKQGFSNKEIANILNSSKRTIDTHRQNIRRKLRLKNKKINLKSYLMALENT